MSVYKIPRKIKRFEIFQPKTTLKNWYNKQTDKLDIFFNASLYTSTNKPCSTVQNDGVMVSDQDNNFGFDVINKKVNDAVYFGLNWTISKMTRAEISDYPEYIVKILFLKF